MFYKAKKGQESYGEAIGILLLDTTLAPYIPGDVANATTYSFPVRFKKVNGLTVAKMLNKDARFLDPLIKAGQELVEHGVRAITGNCGFMVFFQKKVAEQLEVPVFLSSLLQLPFITRIIGSEQKVGIIPANSNLLDAFLLREVGIDNIDSVYIKGMEGKEYFNQAIIDEVGWCDSEKIESEVVSVAKEMVEEDSKVKAILLECGCLSSYGKAVQDAVNLPVFDYITMINYIYSAVVKKKYEGFM